MKQFKTYQFYYIFCGSNNRKTIICTKLCKAPELTKIYKTMYNNLNCGFIRCIGYEQI